MKGLGLQACAFLAVGFTLFHVGFFGQYPRGIGVAMLIAAAVLSVLILSVRHRTAATSPNQGRLKWFWGRLGNLSAAGLCGLGHAVLVAIPIAAFLYAWSAAYAPIHARCPRVGFMSHLADWLLGACGFEAYASGGSLFLKNPDYLLEFVPDLGKLGIFAWTALMGTLTIVLIFYWPENRKRRVLVLWSAGLVYLVLRYVFMIMIYQAYDEVLKPKQARLGLFYDPLVVFISFVPMVLFVRRAFRGDPTIPAARELVPDRRTSVAVAVFALAALSYCLFWNLRDPGTLKQGRILFDDHYSGEWEQASRRFDKSWYGDLSVYNYSSAAIWLGHHYDVSVNADQRLTYDLISRHDILIIKTPTKKLSDEERAAIERFVREGGGLLLLGDHTNLMGMNTFLNEIAEPFGVRFKYDGVNRYTGGFSYFEPPKLNAHPAVKGMEYFEFLTSCSIDAPLFADDIMVVDDNLSDKPDYSQGSFFGDFSHSPDNDIGPLLMCVGVPYGKGRVVLFSDSTTFNTFTFFMHGHSDLLFGMVDYLNRKNTVFTAARYGFLPAAIAFFALFLWSCRGIRLWPALAGCGIAVMATHLAAMLAADASASRAYAPRVPREKITRVNVLWAKSRYGLPPAVGSTELPMEYAMDTFYVTLQRMGYVPSLKRDVATLIHDADVAVIINPAEHFDEAEIAPLKIWVERGGRLLVLENSFDLGRSHLNDFLSLFEVQLHVENGVHFHGIEHVHVPDSKLAVFGKRVGNGRLVLALDSKRFSRQHMGHCFEKPGREERAIYESQFAIFEQLLLKEDR